MVSHLVAMWRLGHVFSVMVPLAAFAKLVRTSAFKPYLTLPYPLTLLALKAGPCEPQLGLSIGGQVLGGNQKWSRYQTTTQTNKQTPV